jgi:hypothetical protein
LDHNSPQHQNIHPKALPNVGENSARMEMDPSSSGPWVQDSKEYSQLFDYNHYQDQYRPQPGVLLASNSTAIDPTQKQRIPTQSESAYVVSEAPHSILETTKSQITHHHPSQSHHPNRSNEEKVGLLSGRLWNRERLDSWSVDDVCDWLMEEGFDSNVISSFKGKKNHLTLFILFFIRFATKTPSSI